MKFSRLLIVFLLFPVLLFSQVKISGKILGADGKPPLLAHVFLKNYDQNVRDMIKTGKVAPDGSFEITVDEPGMYYLMFTAVSHNYLFVPLMVEKEMAPVRLTAKLTTLPYKEKFDEVQIIGDWNDFSFTDPEKMTQQPDGTFTYERECRSDTLAYQLIGLTVAQRSVNGTQANRYVYDGGGDYRSIVDVSGAKAKIIFDPKKLLKLPPEENVPQVTFENNNDFQEMWEMQKIVNENSEKYIAGFSEFRKTHKNLMDYQYDWSPIVSFIKGKFENSESPQLRQFAGSELATLAMYRAKLDSMTRTKIVDTMPIESPLWGINNGFMLMIYPDQNKAQELLEQLKDKNPFKVVRAIALSNLAMRAYVVGDKEKVKQYYAELKEKYSDVKEVQLTLSRLDPNKKIMVGKKVPDFEVQLLDSQEKISNKSLLGKYYLLDFWAVWCGPCVGEMENLHKAHQHFKDKVQFISLSLDAKKEDVAKFRAKKWKMPWTHAFLNEDPNKSVAKIFEVMAIPRPILVNPQGVIVALEGELRGQRLLDTLAKFTQTTKIK